MLLCKAANPTAGVATAVINSNRKTMMAHQSNTRVKVPNLDPGADTDFSKSHDGLSSNLTRRDRPDYGVGKRKTLLRCKDIITVSTMNVRTIREQRCREELVSNLNTYDIDILGLQEHRIVHDDVIRYETIQGKTLITISATRNKAGAATGGVGILLNKRAQDALAIVEPFNDRILIVKLPSDNSHCNLLPNKRCR